MDSDCFDFGCFQTDFRILTQPKGPLLCPWVCLCSATGRLFGGSSLPCWAKQRRTAKHKDLGHCSTELPSLPMPCGLPFSFGSLCGPALMKPVVLCQALLQRISNLRPGAPMMKRCLPQSFDHRFCQVQFVHVCTVDRQTLCRGSRLAVAREVRRSVTHSGGWRHL